MFVSGSNYVRKINTVTDVLCINVLLASVFYVLQSKDIIKTMKPIHTQTYIFNIHKSHRRRIKFITQHVNK